MRSRKPRDPAVTSRVMSRVRRQHTAPELTLRRCLWRNGLRYRLHLKSLPGTPDIVFQKSKVAVFVDGDFWHGRILVEEGFASLVASLKTERSAFWIAKITKNVERDTRDTYRLRARGYAVVRVWASDVNRDCDKVADRITRIVRRRAHADHPPQQL